MSGEHARDEARVLARDIRLAETHAQRVDLAKRMEALVRELLAEIKRLERLEDNDGA